MKRYLLLILSLACLFSGCNYCLSNMLPRDVCETLPWNSRGYPPSYLVDYELNDRFVYDRILCHVADMAVKFSHERRMKLENSTLQYDGGIQSMRLDFSTMALLELEEGRELLVDITEDFLNRINSDGAITALLPTGVLSSDDLEVQINFRCWLGKLVDFDYAGWITLKNGWAHYYAFDMRTNRLDWWQLRNETYYESYKIVQCTREAEAAWDKMELEKLGPSALEEDRFMYKAE